MHELLSGESVFLSFEGLPPSLIEELKETVSAFAVSLTPAEIMKAVCDCDILPRAEASKIANKLKKHNRELEEWNLTIKI